MYSWDGGEKPARYFAFPACVVLKTSHSSHYNIVSGYKSPGLIIGKLSARSALKRLKQIASLFAMETGSVFAVTLETRTFRC